MGDRWGYVYLIAGADLFKIGRARNPHLRLGDLQMGSPVPLAFVGIWRVPDAVAAERRLHHHFAADRRHGEWFRLSDPALVHCALLEEVPEAEAQPLERPVTVAPSQRKERKPSIDWDWFYSEQGKRERAALLIRAGIGTTPDGESRR